MEMNEKDTLDVFDEKQIQDCIRKLKCGREDLLEAVTHVGNRIRCLELYLQMNNKAAPEMTIPDFKEKSNS